MHYVIENPLNRHRRNFTISCFWQKLDTDTWKDWEHTLKASKDWPKLDELFSLLEATFGTFETIENSVNRTYSNKSSNSSNNRNKVKFFSATTKEKPRFIKRSLL